MQKNGGFTLVELLVVVAVITVVAAIAIPGFLQARASANEASAIASVRAINSAQSGFAATCGSGGYASSLTALATAPTGSLPFISTDLAGGSKNGYALVNAGGGAVVKAAVDTCNASAASMQTYLVTATPQGGGVHRSFGSDQQGAIYQDHTGAVLVSPLAVSGNVTVLQ